MCGIVGLFLKTETLRPRLGGLLTDMLITMTDRGPDSAGIAVYGAPQDHKLTVQSDTPDTVFPALEHWLQEQDATITLRRLDTHAVVSLPAERAGAIRAALAGDFPGLRVMGSGKAMEIFKEVGLPRDVADRFGLREMAGSHGIGHTRMATESAVTTDGAHPFSTGPDQCLVHNGSLSNHNGLRRTLAREGITVSSQNDSEVAAAYLTWKMREGANLGQALEAGLSDLDGFYTFVVGTETGFGVLRDPVACKPAVLAETEDYVAFGSEYRALVDLPGIDTARVWEPEPATVYFWER
ncbi:class II glutamine amidotransferase [Roseisalinus antarcticus]|uniref:Glutamine--fructose-6-phosphate aminotransferase [isomerizing] n=1 Tax=Roseisalinus antarcticus TaxID=254357 RepID=A0A1Y5SX34_9RHOB|nr:glutamine amidotransferase family protein [Roseisalinus antarcticus]SLN49872.1 Glutamine--fructose-6-phosphate aminotransferase [isomerizing] [Roseisalinus antarcticus]